MKSRLLLYLIITCCIPLKAQESPVKNYFQQAGYHAEIYNGKMEDIYNPRRYRNLPYYMSSDFVESSIVYRKNLYPSQRVRLDLFKEQLVVVPPGKQPIVLAPSNVEKVYMYGKTFVWLSLPKGSELKDGYYMQLFDGEKMQLFCKEKYDIRKSLQSEYVTFHFEHEIKHYLFYNDRYRAVKNKDSFSKIFPQYKKQINQFAKDHKLDFKKDPNGSLTSLAAYCENLLNTANKP